MLLQLLAALVMLLCAWAILSRNVPTGAVITLGLGLIALGCLAVFDTKAAYVRSLVAVLGGNVMVAVGMLWRGHRARRAAGDVGSPRRRTTDFGGLDEAQRS